jgi:thioredoxin-like negative regulator of GroEL
MESSIDVLASGRTLAEEQGITQEIGDAIACLAEAELEAGRTEIARAILEGLVVTNHQDAGAWALLSRAHRKLANPLAARFCAEVSVKLAPADPHARLARAESLLARPEERDEARAELAALASGSDPGVGPRARALLDALSP